MKSQFPNLMTPRDNLSGADEEKTKEIVFMGVTRLREIMSQTGSVVLISFKEQTIIEILSVYLGKMNRLYSFKVPYINTLGRL